MTAEEKIREAIANLNCNTEISSEILEWMDEASVNIFTRILINYNIFIKGGTFNNWLLRKRLYQRNYEDCYSLFRINDFKYRPVSERNQKIIFLFTEDIVYLSHSDLVMNWYNVLENLGYTPLIVCLPVQTNNADKEYYGLITPAKTKHNGQVLLNINGKPYRYIQIELCAEKITDIYKLIISIYNINPYCIININCQSPIADIMQGFTDVISKSFFSGVPMSMASKKIMNDGLPDDNLYQIDIEKKNGTKLFKQKYGYCVTPSQIKANREDFGIDPHSYVVAVVGTRLDSEINYEEIQKLIDISKIDERIVFAFIGNTSTLNDAIYRSEIADKSYFLGLQMNLMNTIGIANVFYNPKRLGGGLSALYALNTGVPVLTLNNCDVAGNVGNEFIYESFDYMLEEIKRCVSDEIYQKQRSQKAFDRAKEISDNTLEETKQMLKEFVG